MRVKNDELGLGFENRIEDRCGGYVIKNRSKLLSRILIILLGIGMNTHPSDLFAAGRLVGEPSQDSGLAFNADDEGVLTDAASLPPEEGWESGWSGGSLSSQGSVGSGLSIERSHQLLAGLIKRYREQLKRTKKEPLSLIQAAKTYETSLRNKPDAFGVSIFKAYLTFCQERAKLNTKERSLASAAESYYRALEAHAKSEAQGDFRDDRRSGEMGNLESVHSAAAINAATQYANLASAYASQVSDRSPIKSFAKKYEDAARYYAELISGGMPQDRPAAQNPREAYFSLLREHQNLLGQWNTHLASDSSRGGSPFDEGKDRSGAQPQPQSRLQPRPPIQRGGSESSEGDSFSSRERKKPTLSRQRVRGMGSGSSIGSEGEFPDSPFQRPSSRLGGRSVSASEEFSDGEGAPPRLVSGVRRPVPRFPVPEASQLEAQVRDLERRVQVLEQDRERVLRDLKGVQDRERTLSAGLSGLRESRFSGGDFGRGTPLSQGNGRVQDPELAQLRIEIQKARAQLSRITREKEGLEDQLARRQSDLDSLRGSLGASELKALAQQRRADEADARFMSLSSQRQLEQEELRRAQEEALRRARESEERLAEAVQHLSEMDRRRQEGVERELALHAARAKYLEAELDQVRAQGKDQVEASQLVIAKLREKMQELQAQLAVEQSQVKDLRSKKRQILEQQRAQQKREATLRAKLRRKSAGRSIIDQKRQEAAAWQLLVMRAKHAESDQQKRQVQEELAQVQESLEQSQLAQRRLSAEVATLRAKEVALNTQIEVLQREAQSSALANKEQLRQQRETLEAREQELSRVKEELASVQQRSITSEQELNQAREQVRRMLEDQRQAEEVKTEALSQVRDYALQVARITGELARSESLGREKDERTQVLQEQLRRAQLDLAQAQRQAQDKEREYGEQLARTQSLAQSIQQELAEKNRDLSLENTSLRASEVAAKQSVLEKEELLRLKQEDLQKLTRELSELRTQKEQDHLEHRELIRFIQGDRNELALRLQNLSRARDQAQAELAQIQAASTEAQQAHQIAIEGLRDEYTQQLARQAEEHARGLAQGAQERLALASSRDHLQEIATQNASEIARLRDELAQLTLLSDEIRRERDQLKAAGRDSDRTKIAEIEAGLIQAEKLQVQLQTRLDSSLRDQAQSAERTTELETRLRVATVGFQSERTLLEATLSDLREKASGLEDQLGKAKGARVDSHVGRFVALLKKKVAEKRATAAEEKAASAASDLQVAREDFVGESRRRAVEQEAEREKFRQRFSELDGELHRLRAQNADLRVRLDQAGQSLGASPAGLKTSGGLPGMLAALKKFEPLLGQEGVDELQRSYRGTDFERYKAEVLDPVCRLSQKSKDREMFLQTRLKDQTQDTQMQVFNEECIPLFLEKFSANDAAKGKKYKSLEPEEIKAVRKRTFKAKLRRGLQQEFSSIGDRQLLDEFIERYVDDEFRTISCPFPGVNPFLNVESLNQSIHQVKERLSSDASQDFTLKSALHRAIEGIESDFIYHPYTRLNENLDCTKDYSTPPLKDVMSNGHRDHLHLLKNPIVAKKMKELKGSCPKENEGVFKSEVQTVRVDGKPIEFIFYCGHKDGESFEYLVPTKINHHHYYVGTAGTLKDHYWGIRVDGKQDEKPFLFRHVRPKGQLCREGKKDEAIFDKTAAEQANEDAIEKRVYQVTGRVVETKGEMIKQEADSQGASLPHKYEMVEYLGTDFSRFNGRLSTEDVKKCQGDILDQVKRLHANQVIVRDIKPQNVIYRASGGGRGAQCTLIDFGSSLMIASTAEGQSELVSAGLNFTDQYSPIDLAQGLEGKTSDQKEKRRALVQENLDRFRSEERKLSRHALTAPFPTIDTLGSSLISSRHLSADVEARFLSPQLDLYQTGYMLAFTHLKGRPDAERAMRELDHKLVDLKAQSAASNISRKINELKTFLQGKDMASSDADQAVMLLFVLDQKVPGQASLANREDLVVLANLCLYVDKHYCQYWNPNIGGRGSGVKVNQATNDVTVNWNEINKHGQATTSKDKEKVGSKRAALDLIETERRKLVVSEKKTRSP